MFLKLSVRTREGDTEARTVAVADISHFKPAPSGTAPARTCVALISQPDFPIWALEEFALIEEALVHLQVPMAPHRRPDHDPR